MTKHGSSVGCQDMRLAVLPCATHTHTHTKIEKKLQQIICKQTFLEKLAYAHARLLVKIIVFQGKNGSACALRPSLGSVKGDSLR